ncbi:MAG TPA: hypothetical protein VJ044_20225, partial [Candidatus Hodarchaeales archaeon]|nr:hypothetical protein [Candidatus Hodarchaeales archaeon]
MAIGEWVPNLRNFPSSGPFYIKDPKENLNKNQTRRARKLLASFKKFKHEFYSAENLRSQCGPFKLEGSPLLPHGEISKLGFVVGCTLSFRDTKLTFTGDILGGPLEVHKNWMISSKPDILVMDGPTRDHLPAFRENFSLVVDALDNLKVIILEHHLLRSMNWVDLVQDQITYATEKGIRMTNYADLIGQKVELLEANRKNLYDFFPESSPAQTLPKKRRGKKAGTTKMY